MAAIFFPTNVRLNFFGLGYELWFHCTDCCLVSMFTYEIGLQVSSPVAIYFRYSSLSPRNWSKNFLAVTGLDEHFWLPPGTDFVVMKHFCDYFVQNSSWYFSRIVKLFWNVCIYQFCHQHFERARQWEEVGHYGLRHEFNDARHNFRTLLSLITFSPYTSVIWRWIFVSLNFSRTKIVSQLGLNTSRAFQWDYTFW